MGREKGWKMLSTLLLKHVNINAIFLRMSPDYAIMTNIDFDHPDYFKDLDDVLDAFGEMALRVKKAIIACGDDQPFTRNSSKCTCRLLRF